jgi:hypothetical protein
MLQTTLTRRFPGVARIASIGSWLQRVSLVTWLCLGFDFGSQAPDTPTFAVTLVPHPDFHRRRHRGRSSPAARHLRVVPSGESPPEPASLADADDALSATVLLAFAPLHKRAFGVAIGTAVGLALLLANVASLVLDPAGRLDLSLLAQYFAGYSVSWTGAIVGAGWGFIVGFVAGWFTAFVRNLVLATWLLVVRARAELAATGDFLDHI